MNLLYCTADTIGAPGGGGTVTKHEYQALDRVRNISKHELIFPVDALQVQPSTDPFETDLRFKERVAALVSSYGAFRLAHFYAGCFTETIKFLRQMGTKITYTAAAHDPDASMKEFASLGIPYPYPHMRNMDLFTEYTEGYRLAHVVICPSEYSKGLMKSFGCNDVRVIPHGIDGIPPSVAPLPSVLTVGYLGAGGPDKGLRHLLQAWKDLEWGASKLVIAGNNIDAVLPLWRRIGGAVELKGFVDDVGAFYDSLSIYIQPSVTEGFGIEILEAMAHGRLVAASSGAGASEYVGKWDAGVVFKAGSTSHICGALTELKRQLSMPLDFSIIREHCQTALLWSEIEDDYRTLWASVI